MVGASSDAIIQIFNCNKSRYNYARAATHYDHLMEAFSVLLPICAGNSPVTGDLRQNKTVE